MRLWPLCRKKSVMSDIKLKRPGSNTEPRQAPATTSLATWPSPTRRGLLRLAGAGAAALGVGLLNGRAEAANDAAATYGNRIPKSWYWFQGLGVSSQGYGDNPYETFAYDIALKKGGVEDYNVVPYTSVLPRIAYGNIPAPQIAPDGTITRPDSVRVTPGSVLEVIMSQQGMTVPPGETWTIATGLGIRWAAEAKTPGTLRNGYAAEYIKVYRDATRQKQAEQAAKDAVMAALEHELGMRGLVPYSAEPDPTLVVLANDVDNRKGTGPLYATQITGLGCYEYVFPPIHARET
jgi:arginine decarboxylase